MMDEMRTTASLREERARKQLQKTLLECLAPPPDARGKVRDLYFRRDEILLVATDRVSAFDVVLGTVPLKGEMLTEQASFWLNKASGVIPTHLLERVDAQVMRCARVQPLPVEMVVRGYLAGSLMREPRETRGAAYGLQLDPNLGDYERLDTPIVTPTTKAEVGQHDQPCSLQDLVASGAVSQKHLSQMVEAALALFDMGAKFASEQGLLLVDTKYEFGLQDDRLVLIDEVHTADSSRFWKAEGYTERIAAGQTPEMLDKERLRRWLSARGFMGSGTPPALSEEIRLELTCHYWELTEMVLGQVFSPTGGDTQARVESCLRQVLDR